MTLALWRENSQTLRAHRPASLVEMASFQVSGSAKDPVLLRQTAMKDPNITLLTSPVHMQYGEFTHPHSHAHTHKIKNVFPGRCDHKGECITEFSESQQSYYMQNKDSAK